MANEDIDEPEEGFEELEEEFDDDADLDADLDDDVEIDDDEDDDDGPAPSKGGKDDFAAELTEQTYEQAVRANPKRLAMVQKRAGVIEGILDRSELDSPDGIKKAWDTLNKEINTAVHKPYSVSEKFSENEVVLHPIFGIGFVNQILTSTKVEIVFESGIKRLACNR